MEDYTVEYLLGQPWISRIWTLQEVLLASRSWIRCGTERLEWRQLLFAMAFISQCGLNVDRNSISCWIAQVKLWYSLHILKLEPSNQARDLNTLGEMMAFGSRQQTYHHFFYWVNAFHTMPGLPVATILHIGLLLCTALFAMDETIHAGYHVADTCLFIAFAALCLTWWGLTLCVRYSLGGTSHISRYQRSWAAIASLNPRRAIIQEIRRRRCVDPKDKSHGVCAVLSRWGLQLSPPGSIKDCHDIYRDLFLGLLEWSSMLNLILCASGAELAGQPS